MKYVDIDNKGDEDGIDCPCSVNYFEDDVKTVTEGNVA